METMKKKTTEVMAPKTLTDLPDNVIEEILCRLRISEAVRTCVLSHSWRRRWQSIPDLDLCRTPHPIASQILTLHSGNIRLLGATADGDGDVTIASWLSGLSARAAATLRTLHLLNYRCYLDIIARYFPRLNHLRLTGGSQHLDRNRDFSGFKSLQTLHLQSVVFRGHLSMLLSACPLLETASLIRIRFEERQCLDNTLVAPNLRILELTGLCYFHKFSFTIDGDCFSGLKNLRTLHISKVVFRGHVSTLFSACPLLEAATLRDVSLEETQRLDLIAPNLRFFKLVDVAFFYEFAITAAPLLEVVVLLTPIEKEDSRRGGDGNVMTVLGGGIPNVKELELGVYLYSFNTSGKHYSLSVCLGVPLIYKNLNIGALPTMAIMAILVMDNVFGKHRNI